MLYVLVDKSDLQKLERQQNQTIRLMFSVERAQSLGEVLEPKVGTKLKLYLVVTAFLLFVQTNCKASQRIIFPCNQNSASSEISCLEVKTVCFV